MIVFIPNVPWPYEESQTNGRFTYSCVIKGPLFSIQVLSCIYSKVLQLIILLLFHQKKYDFFFYIEVGTFIKRQP